MKNLLTDFFRSFATSDGLEAVPEIHVPANHIRLVREKLTGKKSEESLQKIYSLKTDDVSFVLALNDVGWFYYAKEITVEDVTVAELSEQSINRGKTKLEWVYFSPGLHKKSKKPPLPYPEPVFWFAST